MNVIRNIHQVASGVACIQMDVMSSRNDVEGNLHDKGELLVARFRTLFQNVAGPMNNLKKMLHTLDQKATRLVDVMRRHYRTIADLSNQCRNMIHTPYAKCLEIFDDSYHFCKTRTRTFGLADTCDLIRKTAKICHQAKDVTTDACSFPAIMTRGVKGAAVPFYSAYFTAIEFAVKKVFFVHIEAAKWAKRKIDPAIEEIRKASNFKINYQSSEDGKPNAADDTTANLRSSIRKSLMRIVNFYINIINTVSFVLRYLLMPCLLIWPFIYTLRFIYAFNFNDEFKNRFITNEFLRIDRDCVFRKCAKVMPMTKAESAEYIGRDEWKMTEIEKPRYHFDLFMTILTAFTPLFICVLDIGVFKSLQAVFLLMERTNIETPSHYEIKVAGNSSMARIMNEFLDVFSPFSQGIRERENRWRRCFREPEPPNYSEQILLLVMFVVALFLCRVKAYLGRQALALADYFYPNRVRIRALTLYNRILQKRRSILKEMMGMKGENAHVAPDDIVARRTFQSRGFVSVDCAKCDKYDLKVADQENVRLCVNCGAFYCIDCFCFTTFCTKCDSEMQQINNIELYHEDDGTNEAISDPTTSSSEDSPTPESSGTEVKV